MKKKAIASGDNGWAERVSVSLSSATVTPDVDARLIADNIGIGI